MHDQCYNDAMQHPECWPILDNPYTEFYDYSCDKENKKITCGSEFTTTIMSFAHKFKSMHFSFFDMSADYW